MSFTWSQQLIPLIWLSLYILPSSSAFSVELDFSVGFRANPHDLWDSLCFFAASEILSPETCLGMTQECWPGWISAVGWSWSHSGCPLESQGLGGRQHPDTFSWRRQGPHPVAARAVGLLHCIIKQMSLSLYSRNIIHLMTFLICSFNKYLLI